MRGRGPSARNRSVDCPRGNLWRSDRRLRGQSNVESRIAAAKSRDRPKKASILRTQSSIDGRHLGLWISCDLHGHAVKAILAALMTTLRAAIPRRPRVRDREATEVLEVRSVGSWARFHSLKPGKVWGRKRPPTKQSRTTRRSELGVVKRSIPRSANDESRMTRYRESTRRGCS